MGTIENAQQTDETWLDYAKVWLQLCNTSWERPGFVYIDGHSSHVTRAFIHIAEKHSVYVIVEPSHTSIVLQVADVGINRLLKEQHSREYTSGICATNVVGNIFYDSERVGFIVRSLHSLQNQKELIVNCFKKCALLSGYRDVRSHFPPSEFNAGALLRDLDLPKVDATYVSAVLSLKNLSDRRGAPVTIPASVITEEQRLFQSSYQLSSGYRQFYFALGATASTMFAEDGKQNVVTYRI